MTDINYRRNVDDLTKVASLFWPAELSEKVADQAVIPLLLETQDAFISILSVPVSDVQQIFTIIEASDMPANLFIKHLMVLSDFSGEMLKRVNGQFNEIFPQGKLQYLSDGDVRDYQFQALPERSNIKAKLGIESAGVFEKQPITALHRDVAAIILLGKSSIHERTSQILDNCEVGNFVGKTKELAQYVRQRYIWVSRQTAGSTSNALGHAAQEAVREFLRENLPGEIDIQNDGSIPSITHRDPETGELTTFDLVISFNNRRFVGIEISFQVTTNSVIERKSREAQAIFDQVESAGHKVAYVIDGAGNMERSTAVGTICRYSHCTVAFTKPELHMLCNFLKEYLCE